jgi:Uri superfamily endonuclease
MTAPAASGTYILLVEFSSTLATEIGRLGTIHFDAGMYWYVGSAFGPGGLAARLRRAALGPRRVHWHIDYVLTEIGVVGALVRAGDTRRECSWAHWVRERALGSVAGFGSSDCRCRSHFFFMGDGERTEEMLRAAGYDLKATYFDRRSLMAGKDLVHCQNPDPNKRGVNVPRWKYETVRSAIRRALQERPGGVEFKALPGLVRKNLDSHELARLGSVPWYTTVVKLHLETIGEVERVPNSRPQVVCVATPAPGSAAGGE